MLNFWRLDTENDFFLVSAPSWETASIVRAYHLELLALARSPHNSHLPAVFLFEKYHHYFRKISDRLTPCFDPSNLLPNSIRDFFIAVEKRGDFWISGLELLMGYDYEEGERVRKVSVTSGNFELDVLAELLLLPNSTQIEWLTKTLSPQQLAALTKQVGDRLRGKEALDELQREQDLKVFEQQQGVDRLKKAGFSL